MMQFAMSYSCQPQCKKQLPFWKTPNFEYMLAVPEANKIRLKWLSELQIVQLT